MSSSNVPTNPVENSSSSVVTLLLPENPSPSAVTLFPPENPSRSPLTRLPPELLAMICDQLPPLSHESAAALALTSRRLYPPLARNCAALDRFERRKLLALLEKDDPRVYVCERCWKLHLWRLTPPGSSGIAHYDACCKLREDRPDALPPHESYGLQFHVVRLVMNRHFYGEAHGPALDALSFQGIQHDPAAGIKMQQSWRARIIANELFLEASVQVYHDKGSAAALRDFVDNPPAEGDARRLVCHHISLRKSVVDTDEPQIPWWGSCNERVWELDKAASSDDNMMFAHVKGELKSCRLCLTDFRINVEEQLLPHDSDHVGDRGGGYGWVIDVKRWVQLGSCRGVHDPKWHNYVTPSCEDILLSRRRICGVGGVYLNWIKADDETTRGPSNPLLARKLPLPFGPNYYHSWGR